MQETTYVSKEKQADLKKELEFLKTTRRKQIADKLEYAKSLGDLSENAEYHEAREDQSTTERRIAELEMMLQNAVVVEKHHSEKVEVGSVVIVKRAGSKEEKKFQIVGSEESDTKQGKISHVSPLGSSLMGKKKGDKAVVRTPNGDVSYEVVTIE